MTRLRLILAAVLMVMTAVAALADTRYVRSPNDGFLNLRTGPGTKYDIILRMYNGEYVEVLEYSGTSWVRVQHESGATGWASAKYMVKTDLGTGERLYVYSPNDGFLNLRTGPGTSYRVVRRMYNDDRVIVRDRNASGTWLRVEHESGSVGWAYYKYLIR